MKSGRRRGAGMSAPRVTVRSSCGVVIIGTDRNKWITISKIAVFVGICTAMIAEVVGVCVLYGYLGHSLEQKSVFENYQRIY